ncbi:uncharacterized protein LOC126623880 [Malus sylvestris]|uniref:uncharacterized protein LOC126623880 n=1 Tax=Malus sylvestris TaxID=3752 RepID=UPI0021ACF5CF|nr:uncharacterized protein LOC126623880 [Malus sylvestris]
MARNSISGLLMRQALLGSGNGLGNGSFQTQGLGRLDNPKFFLNCMQTLKTLNWISTAPSLSPSIHITSTPKSPVFLDSLHFLQHRRRLSSAPAPAQFQSPSPFLSPREIKFPSPAAMVILREEDEYRRAIRKVKDEQLPAVFYFVRHDAQSCFLFGSPTTRKMREQFPHVTVYKFVFDIQNWHPLAGLMGVSSLPTFHFYQNGKKVGEIFPSRYLHRPPVEIPNLVLDTCEKLYRHVIHPMGSSGKGKGKRKSTYQQLVVQAKTDANENDKVVALGGGRVGDASTSSEQSDGPVESVHSRGSAPSLDEAMRAVSANPYCYEHSGLWWYAKGILKANPEKRATLLKVGTRKVSWLRSHMSED